MHAPEQRIAEDETKLLRFALSRARVVRRGPRNRMESAERCTEAATKGSEGKRNESKNSRGIGWEKPCGRDESRNDAGDVGRTDKPMWWFPGPFFGRVVLSLVLFLCCCVHVEFSCIL